MVNCKFNYQLDEFFDIGINNGLKNKFAEAKAMNNEVLIQKYVSTTYFVLALIFVPLMILLLIANTFIDWCSWLNVSFLLNEQLQIIIAIVVIYFVLILSYQPLMLY